MRKPCIIKTRFAPKRYCINILGLLFARDTSWIDDKIVNHELIHTAQMQELLYLPFYLIYIIEWIVRLIQYKNRELAYRNISFEREAYANGGNLDYLKLRPRFAWIKYLCTQKK